MLLLFALHSPSSCAPRTVLVLKHGTFFGHCGGRCVAEIEVSTTHVRYTATNINQPQGQDATLEGAISTKEWDDVTHEVDQRVLTRLDDRIGCPDCDDGGGEWVEVSFTDGARKRVTFPYGKPPAQIADLVVKLRAIQMRLEAQVRN